MLNHSPHKLSPIVGTNAPSMELQESFSNKFSRKLQDLSVRFSSAFWAQMKGLSASDATLQAVRSCRHFRIYERFLAVITKIGQLENTSLYYPGAGLDFITPAVLGFRQSYLVDPIYFSRSGYSHAQLRQLIRNGLDRKARFRSSTGKMRALIHIRSKRLVIWLIGSRNTNAADEVPCHGKLVYVTKSCLQPSVLEPPSWIASCKVAAFAIDFGPPFLSRKFLPRFRDKIFEEFHDRHRLAVFKTFTGQHQHT